MPQNLQSKDGTDIQSAKPSVAPKQPNGAELLVPPLTNLAWSPSLCSNHILHRCTIYTYRNRKSPQIPISINVTTNHRIVSTFHHPQGVSAGTKEMYHNQLQLRFQFIYLSHYNMSISVPLRLIGLSGTGLDQLE